jgi:hypothetical protein
MKLTITWDFIVQILGVATIDGRLGIMLHILSVFLMIIVVLFLASLVMGTSFA